MVRKRPPVPGFYEPASEFQHVRPDDDELAVVHALVIASYDFTCVATRRRFNPHDGSIVNLAVVPIRPTENGGSYDVSNFLPFCADVAAAFKDGDFTIGVDLELVVDLRRIEGDILRRLSPEGEILLPADRAFWPDLENLRYHRTLVFVANAG